MREIKFRAWDKDKRTMLEVSSLVFPEYGIKGVVGFDKEMDLLFEDVILMQSTALKDSKGREIYEGDILTGNKIVEWISAPWGFRNVMNTERKEIIGNIHENPELLK